MSGIIGEISSASRDQTDDIERIGEALAQMDSGAQQNAAMVEKIAAAASSLQEQTRSLGKVVGTFKLGAGALA